MIQLQPILKIKNLCKLHMFFFIFSCSCIILIPGSQTCHDYLVSGPNGVSDSQLSASSQLSYPPNNDGPSRGRLFTDAVKYSNGTYLHGAWSAGINNQRQYIQVGERNAR